jgi:hypothetical protein
MLHERRAAVQCQEETHALRQIALLFDDIVRAGEQRRRHGEAERLRGLDERS